MGRLAALALTLVAGLAQEPGPQPFLRVTAGGVRLAQEGEVLRLDARSEVRPLGSTLAWIEAGAHSSLELAWRGQASATISGPAALVLARAPRLVLERFQVAEVEVRRGTLELELTGLGHLSLSAAALRLRTLPDGMVELLNRGGSTLELRREGVPPLAIAAGQCRRVRAHAPRS